MLLYQLKTLFSYACLSISALTLYYNLSYFFGCGLESLGSPFSSTLFAHFLFIYLLLMTLLYRLVVK